MSFILNLITFLLIVFGFLFLTAFNNMTITNKNEITQEKINRYEIIIIRGRLISLSAIILGIGIIVARIFS